MKRDVELHSVWLEDWVRAFVIWMSSFGTITLGFIFGEWIKGKFVVSERNNQVLNISIKVKL